MTDEQPEPEAPKRVQVLFLSGPWDMRTEERETPLPDVIPCADDDTIEYHRDPAGLFYNAYDLTANRSR